MGKRITVQQQVILEAVARLNCHATAEEVFEYIAVRYPSISKATVYRNLSQMADSGKLMNIGKMDGSSRYDHKMHNHYHFICDDCKCIIDIESYFPDLDGRILSGEAFSVSGHQIHFQGICRECKNKQGKEGE